MYYKEEYDEIINKIIDKRKEQIENLGSEYDLKKSPNDWVAIISHYVTRECTRNTNMKGNEIDSEEFQESLEKAAAVILAAIEHIDDMKNNNYLK